MKTVYGAISEEDIMSKLSPELTDIKDVVDKLILELANINVCLSYFDAELKHTNDCNYLYRPDILGFAFSPIRQNMYITALMSLARLYDNASVSGDKTLGFNQLMSMCNKQNAKLQQSADRFKTPEPSDYYNVTQHLREFKQRQKELKKSLESIRIRRNKLYAHNDFATSADDIAEKYKICLSDFQQVYHLMFDFTSYVNSCLIGTSLLPFNAPRGFEYMFSALPEAMKLYFEHHHVIKQ